MILFQVALIAKFRLMIAGCKNCVDQFGCICSILSLFFTGCDIGLSTILGHLWNLHDVFLDATKSHIHRGTVTETEEWNHFYGCGLIHWCQKWRKMHDKREHILSDAAERGVKVTSPVPKTELMTWFHHVFFSSWHPFDTEQTFLTMTNHPELATLCHHNSIMFTSESTEEASEVPEESPVLLDSGLLLLSSSFGMLSSVQIGRHLCGSLTTFCDTFQWLCRCGPFPPHYPALQLGPLGNHGCLLAWHWRCIGGQCCLWSMPIFCCIFCFP